MLLCYVIFFRPLLGLTMPCKRQTARGKSTMQLAFARLYYAMQCLFALHYSAVQFAIPSEHVGRVVLYYNIQK